MTKPTLSPNFNVNDIRKIRDYNSMRHIQMTPSEIVADTKKNAAKLLENLKSHKA